MPHSLSRESLIVFFGALWVKSTSSFCWELVAFRRVFDTEIVTGMSDAPSSGGMNGAVGLIPQLGLRLPEGPAWPPEAELRR